MKTRVYETLFFLSLLAVAAAALAGCTWAEVQETGGNAGGAVGDAVGAIAADPSKAFTAEGLAVLIGTFVTGFFARQAASISKWAVSGTGGGFIKLLTKVVSFFKNVK